MGTGKGRGRGRRTCQRVQNVVLQHIHIQDLIVVAVVCQQLRQSAGEAADKGKRGNSKGIRGEAGCTHCTTTGGRGVGA